MISLNKSFTKIALSILVVVLTLNVGMAQLKDKEVYKTLGPIAKKIEKVTEKTTRDSLIKAYYGEVYVFRSRYPDFKVKIDSLANAIIMPVLQKKLQTTAVKEQTDMTPVDEATMKKQADLKKQNVADMKPDTAPEYPGGEKEMAMYIQKNRKMPAAAIKNNVVGSVVVNAKVNPNGTLSDLTINKSLGYGCDEEALRLVREMPIWSPAMKNNQAVETYINIPVFFSHKDKK